MISSGVSSQSSDLDCACRNNDGFKDIVSLNREGRIGWFANSGVGGAAAFSGAQQIVTSSGGYLLDFQVTDIDGDGDVDILVADNGRKSLSWFENTVGMAGDVATDGLFAASPFAISTPLVSPWAVSLGDVNNDGFLDAVGGYYDTGHLTWFPSSPGNASAVPSSARFSQAEYPIGSQNDLNAQLVLLADFDSDGNLDVLGGTVPAPWMPVPP